MPGIASETLSELGNSGTPLDLGNTLALNKEPRGNPKFTAALEGLPKDVRILDVGCGSGNTLLFYRNLGYTNLYGIEVEKVLVEFARKEWGLNITEGPGEDLSSFPDKSFDVVYSNHSLEHMRRPDLALREMYRVLRDDGIAVIGLPNGRHLDDLFLRCLQKLYYGRSDHIQAFSYRSFCDLLAATGFEVIAHSDNYESLHLLMDRRLPFHKVFEGLYAVAKRLYWQVHSFDLVAKKARPSTP